MNKKPTTEDSMNEKRRVKAKCNRCGKTFSYLPRNDGQAQRSECYRCIPKQVGDHMKPIKCTCQKCGHKWESRVSDPKACPNCKRYDWAAKKLDANKE